MYHCISPLSEEKSVFWMTDNVLLLFLLLGYVQIIKQVYVKLEPLGKLFYSQIQNVKPKCHTQISKNT